MKRVHIIISGVIVGLLLAAVGLCFALNWIDFFDPIWLFALLGLPLIGWLAVTGIAGLPPRTNTLSLVTRCILYILIVLCLADAQIVLQNNRLCVLYLMDHSASIPQEIVEKELAYVNASAATKEKKDTAGIVVFGDSPSVEVIPDKELMVDRIYSAIEKEHTDLQGAVELATAAFPANTRKKIVLITDGNQNKGDLMEGLKFASGNKVVVDILPVGYDYDKEVMVEKVFLPDKIKINETFDLRVHILSLKSGPADLAIYRNGINVAKQKLDLKPGRSTYTVSMKIEEPGFFSFTARVDTPADTVLENNEASSYVYIQGSSRILLVSPSRLEISYLAQACREDSLEADWIIPEDLPSSLGKLQNYDCIVLANVASEAMTQNQMAMLQANVRDLGVGLVMIGGEDSFGAGGYEDTPIEEALPVTMDIQQKKINPKGALAMVLHTCEFANGNYWAKQIAKKAIETVNPQDDVGVLLYSGGDTWLFELQPAVDKYYMYRKIDSANPGDMMSFEPTMQLAYDALSVSDAMVRHVIIISDGDPARPRPKLVKDMAAAGITVSTVAINPHSPRDVDVMKYIAYTTGGRYHFASDPTALPKIFSKEAKVVKRSLIFNKPFQPLMTLSTEVTKGIKAEEVPPLMAYVATTPKARALVPFVSDNENHDPVLAYWRYGLGKSVAFTSDATSNWGREWVEWGMYKKFWTQIIRWVSRKREKSPLRMYTQMEGGQGKLIVDAVDQQGKYLNFLKLNGRVVDPNNKGMDLDIRQTAPGRYEADFGAEQTGVSIINIGYQNPETGGQGFAATGISIPYSPEFGELDSNLSLLRRAVSAGGGRMLSGDPKKDKVFSTSVQADPAFQQIWEYLLLLAIFLFFFDVVLRRVIITREDLASAWATVRGRLSMRRDRGRQSSETMAALLKRKEKTFEKVTPSKPVEKSPRDFKKRLDQAAKSRSASLDRSVGALDETRSAAARAEGGDEPAKGPPPLKKKKKKTESQQESYTSRLLDAKRRAHGKKKGESSSGDDD